MPAEPTDGWHFKFWAAADKIGGGFLVYGGLPSGFSSPKLAVFKVGFFTRTYDEAAAKMHNVFFAAGSNAEMLINARLAGIPEDKMLAFVRTLAEKMEEVLVTAGGSQLSRAAAREILRMARRIAHNFK